MPSVSLLGVDWPIEVAALESATVEALSVSFVVSSTVSLTSLVLWISGVSSKENGVEPIPEYWWPCEIFISGTEVFCVSLASSFGV